MKGTAILALLLCFGTAALAQHRNRDGTKAIIEPTAHAAPAQAVTKKLKVSVAQHDGVLNHVNGDPLNTEAVRRAMEGDDIHDAVAMLDNEYDARIDLTAIEPANWDLLLVRFGDLRNAQAKGEIEIVHMAPGTVIRELWSKHHVYRNIVVGMQGLSAVVIKVTNNGIPSYVGVMIGCSNGVLFDREVVEVVPSPVEESELKPEGEPVETGNVDLGHQAVSKKGGWLFQFKLGSTAGNLPTIDSNTNLTTHGPMEARSEHVYIEGMYTLKIKRGTLLQLIGDTGIDYIETSRYQNPDDEGLGARAAARLEAQLSQRVARGWWMKFRAAVAYAQSSDGPAYQGVEVGAAIEQTYFRLSLDFLDSTSPHRESADSTYKNGVVSCVLRADNVIPSVRRSKFGQKVDLGIGFQHRFGEEMRWQGRYGFDLVGNPGEAVVVAYIHTSKHTGLFLRGTGGINNQVSYDLSGPEPRKVGDANYWHTNVAAWLNIVLPFRR